jgi:DNA primase catalytic core
MENNQYISGIINALLPRLREYLEEKNIKIGGQGFFSCIHPNHSDKNPSCSIGGSLNETVFHCFSCLPPFEKIRTPKGLVQICNLKLGDEVYSQYGTGIIINIIKQESKENTIEVQLQTIRNDNIKFTGNHIFKVVKNITEKVPFIKVRKDGNNNLRFFKSLKSKTRSLKYKNKLVISECRADELRENDYVIFPKTSKSISSILTGIENIWIKNYTSGPKNERITTYPINEDTMWLLGLYCAEGSSYRGGITFTLHRNEKQFQEKIKRIIKENFRLDCSTYEYDYKENTTNISCSSTDLQMFFEGFIGKYASYKYISDDIICGLSDSLQKSWLIGLFDGDAGKRKPKNLTLVNENLISTAQQVMVNLEIPFSYRYTESYWGNDGIERKPTWTITWLEKENIGCFYDTASDGYRYAFLRIDKILHHNPLSEVYDITVQEDHNSHTFMTKHYLVHNCGTAGNIFHAVHFLENKPLTGIGFYEDTLKYLADKYEVEYEPIAISDDIKREYQKRRAYHDAVSVIHYGVWEGTDLKTEHPAIQHLTERGITEETIKKFKIGCIDSYSDYLNEMKSMGWTDREWLNGADLANKGLFHKDGIIIPIFEADGNPVGFVTRKTNMAANAKGQEKYCNSLNSDIYHKSEILYNFNNYNKDHGPLYIVEGYLDAVYLTQCGLKNVAAIGATVLTEHHIKLLMDHGAKNIIFCLDADDGGENGIKLAIERLSPYKYFNLRIMELPEGLDPDSFVREHGLEKFTELAKPDVALSAFAWTLKHTTFEDDPMVTAERAIPTIAAEESNIMRLKMIRELSRLTSISELDIKKDVDSLVNKDSSVFIEELNNINNFVQVQLNKRKVKDTRSILEDAMIKIKNLEKLHNNTVDNRTEYETRRNAMREKIDGGEYKYGLYTPRFKKLEKMFDGIPYTTCLSLVGGRPSAGKTTWMTALAMDIVESNDDAAIFYMSIDDTTELMNLKMMATRCGLSTSKIKRYVELPETEQTKVNEAFSWLDKMSERLVISDASSGNTIETLEAHIDWFVKNFPNSKRIFMLDNFHKLSTHGMRSSKYEAVSAMSEKIKTLTQLNDLHLMMTIELRKLEGSAAMPQVADLKDSVQMEYDADAIILAHNDYQVNDKTNILWKCDDIINGEPGGMMPILENRVWKNKVTGVIGPLAYSLNSHNLQIKEIEYARVRSMRAQKSNSSLKVDGGMRSFP